jgi:hypothetical protein
MSIIRWPISVFVCSIIVVALTSACSLLQKINIPASNDQFDNKPETVVIYTYIHYPGVPLPTKTPNDKYCPYLPSLLIWGDGLVFLDEKISNDYKSVLSGKLDSASLKSLLDILNSNNFFTEWSASAPNPSGTSMKIGAQLKDKPGTEHITDIGGPSFYKQITKTIKPALKPLTDQKVIDPRVDAVLKEGENCNKYMYSK